MTPRSSPRSSTRPRCGALVPALLSALALAACGKGASLPAERTLNGVAPTTLALCPDGAVDAGPGGSSCPSICGDLKSQAWNSADAGVGPVTALVELPDQTVLFGDQGATVFLGGVPASSDATNTHWQGAGALPAADGNGTWAVGVGQDGQLSRVNGSGLLEAVSDRWGLLQDKVSAVASTGARGAAFAIAGQVAVSDGTTLRRFDVGGGPLAGGGGRLGWIEGGVVKRLDPSAGAVVKWPLTGAFAVAVSDSGRMIAATPHGLWEESDTLALVQVYQTPATLHALTASGERFWFVQDQQLGFLEGARAARTQQPVAGAATQLFTAPGGGVWMLSGGVPARYSAGGELAVWQQLVLPIFARVCASCHLPGGTAGVTLASLDDWKGRKDAIVQRVLQGVTDKPMPPKNAVLDITPAERNLIRCWVESVK